LQGVKRVFIGPEFVTVTKNEESDWEVLKTIVFSELMDFFQSNEPVLSSAPAPSVRALRCALQSLLFLSHQNFLKT